MSTVPSWTLVLAAEGYADEVRQLLALAALDHLAPVTAATADGVSIRVLVMAQTVDDAERYVVGVVGKVLGRPVSVISGEPAP